MKGGKKNGRKKGKKETEMSNGRGKKEIS